MTHPARRIDTVLLDVDGTLVDSNYHHALAWHRAFREQGRTAEVWRIHHHLGMGGDRLVPAVAGEEFEARCGDAARAAWRRYADEALAQIRPFEGAPEMLTAIADRGVHVVLASSAPKEHVERYVDLLDARSVAAAWTSADDVASTKPAPDLLRVALDRVEGTRALVVGDSVWDAISAQRIGMLSVAVRSGGFSAVELYDAGAAEVFPTVRDVHRALDALLS